MITHTTFDITHPAGTLRMICWMSWIIASTAAVAHPTPSFRFASEATYPPFVTLDPHGHVGGLETELLQAACRAESWHCTFVNAPWDTLLPSLRMGKFDAVYGGLAATPARRQQVAFSDPTYQSTAALVKACTHPVTWSNLSTYRLGLQSGATFFTYLQSHAPQGSLHTYASIQQALLDMRYARLDAVVADKPVLSYWLSHQPASTQPTLCLLDAGPEQALAASYGVAFRLDDTLRLELFNAALQRVQGTARPLLSDSRDP